MKHQSVGAVAISAIVILAFAVLLAVVLTHEVPGSSQDLSKILIGSLAAMASQVVSYWVGSSSGSVAKDEQLSAAQDALADSVPTSALGSVNQSKPEAGQ